MFNSKYFIIIYLGLHFFCVSAIGFENISVKKTGKDKKLSSSQKFQRVFTLYEKGDYEEVLKSLSSLERKIKKDSKNRNKIKGLLYYWKAMAFSKINDYELSEKYFIKSLELKYFTSNIYYEYGQVLYVAEKYKRARIAFRKSLEAKYKKAVSLYYIAFISQELKQYKKAVRFYRMIENIESDDKDDVLQAARMQVGDIYLVQIEKEKDPDRRINKFVIPQYKKALAFNVDSVLAKDLRAKIENLQRKYELALFKMRNGKPTSRPPYYFKTDFVYGHNDNVVQKSEENKSSLAEDGSSYYQVGFFSRYTFYPNSTISIAPELSSQLTKYSSESTSLLPYNNYYIKTAVKLNYEHIYNLTPATFYLNLDMNYSADDADADKEMAFSDNTYGVTLSEELQLIKNHPTTFRVRYEKVIGEDESNDNTSTEFTYEQVILLKTTMLFFYNNYRMTNFISLEESNTNSITSRLDVILPTFFGLFNPTIYLSTTNSNYVNNSERGTPRLDVMGINFNRPIGKRTFLGLDYSLSKQSADLDDDNYKSHLITLGLDFVF